MGRSTVLVFVVEANSRCYCYAFPYLVPISISNLSFEILHLSMCCLTRFIDPQRFYFYSKVGCLFFSINRLLRWFLQPSSCFTISHLHHRFKSNLVDFEMYWERQRHQVCIETAFDCLNFRLTAPWPMLIILMMMVFYPP